MIFCLKKEDARKLKVKHQIKNDPLEKLYQHYNSIDHAGEVLKER